MRAAQVKGHWLSSPQLLHAHKTELKHVIESIVEAKQVYLLEIHLAKAGNSASLGALTGGGSRVL